MRWPWTKPKINEIYESVPDHKPWPETMDKVMTVRVLEVRDGFVRYSSEDFVYENAIRLGSFWRVYPRHRETVTETKI